VRTPGELQSIRSRFNGRLWAELSDEEHQRFPGDYEAQVSQGPITLHSEEHLVKTDRGIVLLRTLLKKQVDAVARGDDPAGVAFKPETQLVELTAGTSTSSEMPNDVED
jgi:hypothetical protein